MAILNNENIDENIDDFETDNTDNEIDDDDDDIDYSNVTPEQASAALEFVQKNGLLMNILEMMTSVDYENGEYDLRMEQTILVDDLSASAIIAKLDEIELEDDEAFGIDFGIKINVEEYNNIAMDADIGKVPALPVLNIMSNNDVSSSYLIARLRGIKKTIDNRTVMQSAIEVAEYNGVIANDKNFGFNGLPLNMPEQLPFVESICDIIKPDVWYKTAHELVYDYDEDLDEADMEGLVIPSGTPVKVKTYTGDEGASTGINYESVIFLIDGNEVEYPAGFWNDETISNIYGMIN